MLLLLIVYLYKYHVFADERFGYCYCINSYHYAYVRQSLDESGMEYVSFHTGHNMSD